MYVGCRFVDNFLLGLLNIFTGVSEECTSSFFMATKSGLGSKAVGKTGRVYFMRNLKED
jgi:hypothetical protein